MVLADPTRVHQAEWPVTFESVFSLLHPLVKLLEVMTVSKIKGKGNAWVYFIDLDLASLCAVVIKALFLLDFGFIRIWSIFRES